MKELKRFYHHEAVHSRPWVIQSQSCFDVSDAENLDGDKFVKHVCQWQRFLNFLKSQAR